MNITDILDIAGPLVIAIGTLPLAAGVARLALQVLVDALTAHRDRTIA